MSKNSKILIVLTILLLLILLPFYEIRKIDFWDNSNLLDFVFRNITRDSTLSKDVFYKKGDELEYYFYIDKDFNGTIGVDTKKIDKILKDYEISIDDKKISKSDLKNLKINNNSIIKFKGIAIEDKTKTDDDNIEDLIDIDNITKEEVIEDIEKTNTGVLNNIYLSNLKFNSNINNLLIITGDNIERISHINIGGVNFNPKYQDNKIYIGIDKGTFDNGDYFIFFQLDDKTIYTYKNKLTFTYNKNYISIANITPKSIKNDIDRYIVIQGNNLSKVIRVQLSNNLVLKETSFNVVNNSVMSIKIPSGLNPGDYYINLMGTNGIFETNNTNFKITK